MADFNKSAYEVSDHAIQKSISIKCDFNNPIFFLHHADGTDPADGGFAFVARVGSKGCKVPFSDEVFGGLSHGGKVEEAGDMPGATDFQGVEWVGVGNTVEVGFALGREAGVKPGFFPPNG